jgi:flagellar motility protein MotE (MotC chaperone)
MNPVIVATIARNLTPQQWIVTGIVATGFVIYVMVKYPVSPGYIKPFFASPDNATIYHQPYVFFDDVTDNEANTNENGNAEQPEPSLNQQDYDKHIADQKAGQQRINDLQKELSETKKGSKQRREIQEKIEIELKKLKGHQKEINQKWPNGRPAN